MREKILIKVLPERLGCKSTESDLIADLINRECKQSNQKMGNCWWIAPKAGMLALLALDNLLNTIPDSSDGDPYLKALSYAQAVYKQFSEFSRLQLLKEYIERPFDDMPRDYELVKKVLKKLESKKWRQVFEKQQMDTSILPGGRKKRTIFYPLFSKEKKSSRPSKIF